MSTRRSLLVITTIAAFVLPTVPEPAFGFTPNNTVFARDLTVGSNGSDVVALQTFLEQRGFLVMPSGVSKGYFGALTRAALAQYQTSKKIVPAEGYFGHLTRTMVNGGEAVFNDVRTRIAEQGSADVLILLHGNEFTAASYTEDDGKKRAEIKRLQNVVMVTLGEGDFTLRDRLEIVPLFVGTLTKSGFEKLSRDPRVKSIKLNTPLGLP